MDGVFVRRKGNIAFILLLLCGIFFVGRYIYLTFVHPNGSHALPSLSVGVSILVWGVSTWLLNHGAFLHVENSSIRAKYHWFGKIDCRLDEVAYASARMQTLTILMKSGRRNVIMGVENALLLAMYIRREIYTSEASSPDDLRSELNALEESRKKALFGVLGNCVLMFAIIFLAVVLTGGKEMDDFSSTDRIVFFLTMVVEVVAFIAALFLAGRCGRAQLSIEYLRYRMSGALIASQPLPSGNPIRVLTNENHIGRIVVYRLPNSGEVFFCVQEFRGNDLRLETVFTSDFFEREDLLFEETDIDDFIDITKNFQ